MHAILSQRAVGLACCKLQVAAHAWQSMRGHAKRQRATMARGGVRKRHVVRGDRAVQRNSMRGHIHRPWAHRTWEKREEAAHIASGVRAFGTPHHSTGRTILTRAPMARTS